VFRSNSIAAIGVAAHETGHAIQHAKAYTPSYSGTRWCDCEHRLFALMDHHHRGFIFGALGLSRRDRAVQRVVVFQIITLPVEFNASSRAKEMLASYGLISATELVGVRKVLSAPQ